MTDTASALPVEERQEVDPNALGIALALSGAALGIIAAWLPVRDPESYRRAHPGEPVNEEVLVQSLPGLHSSGRRLRARCLCSSRSEVAAQHGGR